MTTWPHDVTYEESKNLSSFNTMKIENEVSQKQIAEQIKQSVTEMQEFFKLAKVETDL